MKSLNKKSGKLAPVSLRRQKARRRNKIIFLLLLPFIAVGLYFGVTAAAGWAHTLKTPSWLEWRLKTVKIAAPSQEGAAAAAKFINLQAGTPLKRAQVIMLEDMLRENLKEMEKITVRRNFFNGELKISLKPRVPLAKLNQNGRALFIDGFGTIFPMESAPPASDILVLNVNGEIKDDLLPQELVKLLKALNAARALGFNEITVDAAKHVFTFTTLRGARVYIGGFEGAERKLALVGDMLGAASRKKISPPYEINFNYFDDGKVYLKGS